MVYTSNFDVNHWVNVNSMPKSICVTFWATECDSNLICFDVMHVLSTTTPQHMPIQSYFLSWHHTSQSKIWVSYGILKMAHYAKYKTRQSQENLEEYEDLFFLSNGTHDTNAFAEGIPDHSTLLRMSQEKGRFDPKWLRPTGITLESALRLAK